VTEDGIQECQHRAAMQDAVGIAVSCVGLEAEFGLARRIFTPVIGAAEADEAIGHPERLKPRRG
jgi:hypothetical protein